MKKSVRIIPLLLLFPWLSCHHPSETSSGTEPVGKRTSQPAGVSTPLRTVKLLPYWVPSAQFAGYYVGIEKGIFLKHGIQLVMLPFDPLLPAATVIREKKADFAMLWLVNALEIKNEGVDIVNIAQFSFRSSLMLITKKSSGIGRIEDMEGKRAGIWIGYERQPQALFEKYRLNVKIIPIGSTNNLFLQDGVDILNANWFDEYHSVLNNGINEEELNKFFFADYGFNFLEDGIYCLEEKIRNEPQLCRDFVEATIESWSYAFNNQDEAIEIVVKYAKAMNQPVNRSHQRWMLSHYRELYIPPDSSRINTDLNKKDYDNVQQIMLENRFIRQSTSYESFFHPASKLTNDRR